MHHIPSCASRRTVILIATIALTATARAQSAQPYAVQIAALVTTIQPEGRRVIGAGIEPQLRINRLISTDRYGAVSLGVGAQYTLHQSAGDRLQVAGLFVEPRWALPLSAGCAFPYLSARVAVLRAAADFASAPDGSAFGSALSGGGGISFRMTRTANLDVGAQLVHQEFRSIGAVAFRPVTTYAARVGVTLGVSR